MKQTVKLLIAGSKSFTDGNHLERLLIALMDTELADKEVVVLSTMERGVGALGYQLANAAKLKVEEHPARWDRYGKKAAFMRDTTICKDADAMLLITTGLGEDSQLLFDTMRTLKKPIYLSPM